jgi:peroxidase
MLVLLMLLVSSAAAESDPGADPAILAGHYAPAGYAPVPAAHAPYCANGGYCVPQALCAPSYLDLLYDPAAPCYLAPNTPGVCCLHRKDPYGKRGLLERPERPDDSTSPLKFDPYTLNHAAFVGQQEAIWLQDFESELNRRGVFVNKGSSAFNHFALFVSKPKARQMADMAMGSIEGSTYLGERFGLTANQAGFGLGDFSIEGTVLNDACPRPQECNAYYPYRSYDASCNNIENPLWGTSNSAFQRVLLPAYSDGIFRPRVAKSGQPLPSARLVSINIIPDVDAPSELETHNVMQWGQYVDHDLAHTPLFRLSSNNSDGVKCCEEDGSAPISQLVLHPECFPIEIPENDPFYMKHGQRCMPFVRSLPAPQFSCSFGYGEQMNQITHLLDGSNVYGSDDEDALKLRSGSDGVLETYSPQGEQRQLLPQEEGETKDECAIDERKQEVEDQKCFKAGDSRSNEQPGLTAFHTVWVREHNRIAKELKYLNPYWDDERLYQEARKITVAEYQHITYNEWLPLVLSTEYMAQLDILPVQYGYSKRYNKKVNPTILNGFATAAFRFGHSLIQGIFDLVEEVHYDRKVAMRVPLSNTFFNPELIYKPGALDKFLVGLATQPRQKFDNIFTDQVTNHLFQGKNASFGMDLVALNLQRGRDHGIPGYNAWRELCGLSKASKIKQFSDIIPEKIVDRLALIYEDVDDVDLFIGGISETPVKGGLLGPTFQCIIGDQFKRLQDGDRFFYDSDSNPGKFSEPQLAEIRKASLARVHCDNGDHVQQLQPLVFRQVSQINPLVPCDAITIPKVDLYHWKEDSYGHAGLHHAAPVHTVHHAAPIHHASAALHHTSSYSPTPAPYYAPAPAAPHYAPAPAAPQYAPAPAPHYAPTPAPIHYSPTPAPYTPTIHAQSPYTSAYTNPYSSGGSGTVIKSFIHTPLHSFHGTVGKK